MLLKFWFFQDEFATLPFQNICLVQLITIQIERMRSFAEEIQLLKTLPTNQQDLCHEKHSTKWFRDLINWNEHQHNCKQQKDLCPRNFCKNSFHNKSIKNRYQSEACYRLWTAPKKQTHYSLIHLEGNPWHLHHQKTTKDYDGRRRHLPLWKEHSLRSPIIFLDSSSEFWESALWDIHIKIRHPYLQRQTISMKYPPWN